MIVALAALLLTAPVQTRRVAVVIGANKAPPGRQPLRYAYTDAGRMRDALVSVGRFAAKDVVVLADPTPRAVLNALDDKTEQLKLARAAGEETMLFFYYSGHADMQAIYPKGAELKMHEIKSRIERSGATVRIGVLDACRGGAWTGAKSLHEGEPFDLSQALGLNNEGSVFIASSSGMEDAHESEALVGSFFTHHFVAGMLGAADASNDGEVTLGEAYTYAQALTVRDSAIAASQPQHPSFEMNLKGKSDLTIAELRDAPSSIEVTQDNGPLEVVHLGSGIIVLELSKGPRSVRAALPPGRYLVRLRTPFGTRARAVELEAGVSAFVREEELLLVGSSALATKSTEPSSAPVAQPFVTIGAKPQKKPDGPRRVWVDLNGAVGLGDGLLLFAPVQPGVHVILNQTNLSVSVAPLLHITERLRWAMATLAFDYRFGTAGRYEVTPSLGIYNFSFGVPSRERQDQYSQLFATLGAGVDWRQWLTQKVALHTSFRATTSPTLSQIGPYYGADPQRFRGTDQWQLGAAVGVHAESGRLELTVGVAYSATPWIDGRPAAPAPHVLALGSVNYDGLMPTPLFAIRMTNTMKIVGFGGVAFEVPSSRVYGWGTAGVAFAL